MRITSLASLAGVSLLAIGTLMPRLATAETLQTREVITTTSHSGMVTELPSSSTIVLKSEASPEPKQYMLTEKTTFVDPMGRVVSREVMRNQPVTIHYYRDGDQLVVSKVVMSKPLDVIEKKTTTTTTTELR